MSRIRKWYQKQKHRLYKKYYPTYEWFKFENIIKTKKETPIEETINRFNNFYLVNHNENLFTEKKRIFFDVCYGAIEIEKKFLPILNHPLMIRLMRLNQLSLTYKLFFSANHNRFSHSIGTYEIIKQFIHKLTHTDFSEINKYIKKHQDLLKIYALIHDIGHYPFSHSLEYLFESEDKDMLLEILENDNKLRQIIQNILDENNISIDLLIKLIKSKTKNSEKDLSPLELILKKCIDSPLDADRMDYLYRDRMLCFGEEAKSQIKTIISHMIPYQNEEDGKWLIAYQSSPNCINEIIEFLHKRHTMYSDVYENDDKVILEEIIARILYQFKKKYKINFYNLRFFTEDMIIALLIEYSSEEERNFLNMALFGNGYKKIKSITVGEFLEKKKHFRPMFEKMIDSIEQRVKWERELCELSDLDPNKNFIIFHFPRRFFDESNQITLIDEEGNPSHLENNEQFKGHRILDEKKAQYFQLFLLDIRDGNFDRNKEKVLTEFKKNYLVQE
ncbi:MAG: HD domain-containing protein [Candidatus Helarchaeota archaeon]